MRALADFILRGRLQATAVALIGNWVPLLTPATVALVTLRVGRNNGLLILLWGLLPSLLLLGFSQIAPAVATAVVGGVVLTYLAALFLGRGTGWATCLMGMVALATLFALTLGALAPSAVESAVQSWNQLSDEMASSADAEPITYGAAFVLGLLAYGMAFPAAVGLMIGRWWHSLVANPGGFGAEFQALKLHPVQAIVCMVASLYCLFQGLEYALWSTLFAFPLVVQGVAMMHRLVAIKRLGTQWLFVFYAVLVLLEPATHLLAVLAFLDTWLNFRERAKPRA
ncbi:hypothetical protein [Marinimicrobium locisalis]|uniref:hypothetical protein n=1 Tax=Marinimicrobium locisalis TaxID=546022 RepID=UPI003221CDF3